MKRIILTILAALAMAVGPVLPADATIISSVRQATALAGNETYGCHILLTIRTDYDTVTNDVDLYASVLNSDINNGCDELVMKTQLKRCDGTTSTTIAQYVYDPPWANGPVYTAHADCAVALIPRIWFRAQSNGGTWLPNSTGWVEYSTQADGHYGFPPYEHCYPTADCEGDRNDA